MEKDSTQERLNKTSQQIPYDNEDQKEKRICINLSQTRYEILTDVAISFKWKIILPQQNQNQQELETLDWDLIWIDNGCTPETLSKMKSYQKVNHFPGMWCLGRKNKLGIGLKKMKKLFPKDYNFFPLTYLLPNDWNEFAQKLVNRNKTFIIKPEASCQGRGIFLVRKIEDILPDTHYVAQRYIHNPMLIDDLKFDLRVYVLITGCDPLRIFIYKNGLCRLATEKYTKPKQDNLEEVCMHLTNYAINKNSSKFVPIQNQEFEGHKRDLNSAFKYFEQKGYDVQKLWNQIQDIIIKTICTAQPNLSHIYKQCQPDDILNNKCFQILGFDILIDHKFKPWLLEVNHSPSFHTDCQVDQDVKFSLIKDAIQLMDINLASRMRSIKRQAKLQKERLQSWKFVNSKEQKINEIQAAQQFRDQYEQKELAKGKNQFVKIYPTQQNISYYQQFLQASMDLWEEAIGTKSAKQNLGKMQKIFKLSGKFIQNQESGQLIQAKEKTIVSPYHSTQLQQKTNQNQSGNKVRNQNQHSYYQGFNKIANEECEDANESFVQEKIFYKRNTIQEPKNQELVIKKKDKSSSPISRKKNRNDDQETRSQAENKEVSKQQKAMDQKRRDQERNSGSYLATKVFAIDNPYKLVESITAKVKVPLLKELQQLNDKQQIEKLTRYQVSYTKQNRKSPYSQGNKTTENILAGSNKFLQSLKLNK